MGPSHGDSPFDILIEPSRDVEDASDPGSPDSNVKPGAGTTGLKRPVVLEKMVEAPGVAPGSENTSPQESTMRIRV